MLFVLCCVSACSGVEERSSYTAQQAVIRMPVPGMAKSVGYVELLNQTQTDLRLVAARSELIGAIEFHETREQDGLMRMRRLSELVVPAGGAVKLQPGGKHLMLFRMEPLEVGQQVTVEFESSDGVLLPFEFRVIPFGAES